MLFFAYINNHTDSRDDDVLKIDAANLKMAKAIAESYCMSRGGVSLARMMNRKQLRSLYPGWHILLWGTPPINLTGKTC